MNIQGKLNKLRTLMQQSNIDIYLILTNDYHNSEIVADHFRQIPYLTGFDGSNATLVITQKEALLWTDGRYFIQAEAQLKGSNIKLVKQAVPGYPTVSEYLNRFPLSVVGFNGKQVPTALAKTLKNPLVYNKDLVANIWSDQPDQTRNPIYDYCLSYCGESRRSKLARIREKMGDCNHHLLTTLDDIAWTFNIRGNDIPSSPVGYSYALIDKTAAAIYCQAETIDSKLRADLLKDNIAVKPYDAIYNDVKNFYGSILLDEDMVNYTLYQAINYSCKVVNQENPSQLLKAIKNPTEIANTKNAHLKDGVAMTKFLYWLAHLDTKTDLDEMTISDKLYQLRSQQDLFKEVSFTTISAYQENGAIMHYHPTQDNKKALQDQGLLLVDSGGQYLDGTTDITRTIALGPLSKAQKRDFTIALKAMLRLQQAKFIEGTTGANLDILARGLVYNYDLDYRCGTGHGVGHFLNVHEGPNSFRAKEKTKHPCPILSGMITTVEPGIYQEGKYGIRHENELLCIEDAKNEYGQFFKFEPITYVPFDISALDLTLLSNIELEQLEEYHHLVFTKIAPYLDKEEKDWLAELCNKSLT